MIENLKKSIDPNFTLDTSKIIEIVNRPNDLSKVNDNSIEAYEIFLYLVIYFQIIENADCEEKISGNIHEEHFMNVLKYFSGIEEEYDQELNDSRDNLNDSIDTTNINLNHSSSMKMNQSLLAHTMTLEDPQIKEYEALINQLREENSILKNDLESSKSEINRLTVRNESLDISIKCHQDQSKNNKVEDKNELKKLYGKYEELQEKLKTTIDNYEVERHRYKSEIEDLNEKLSLMADWKEKGSNMEE